MTPETPEIPDGHPLVREMIGAYALGDLSAAEEAEVRAHLETCAACRHELAEIEPAVRALSLISGSDQLPGDPPPDLANRVVSSVAREREGQVRRQRSRTMMIAAAAIPAVLTIGGIGAVVGHQVADESVTADPVVPVEDVPVRTELKRIDASAGVVAHTWGVEIKLEAQGFRKGASYAAVVTTTDGEERPAGAFVGTGSAEMMCNLNSDVLRDDAAGFVVLDDEGRTVLTAEL